MADWQELVRQKLSGLALDDAEKEEVHAELAAHLEESYEVLLRDGVAEPEAVRRALLLASDWKDLQRRIHAARSRKDTMTNRNAQFWLPSLLTVVLAVGFLALIQFFGPKLWTVIWFGRSRWGFVAPSERVFIPWLLSLPLIGTAGAYLSNRAGGSKRVVLYSIVFPVLPYLIFLLVGLPVIAILDDHHARNFMFRTFLVGLFAWVLAPGVALLAGGLSIQLFLSRRPWHRETVTH